MTDLNKISATNDMLWAAFICFALFAITLFLPEMAYASGSSTGQTPLEDTMCEVVNWLVGPTGRALATIAIIIIGIGALMGKVSWGMTIIVVIGIAIVFGAPAIVRLLDPEGDEGACGLGA